MVPLRFPGRDQLVSYLHREWQVCQTIAVQVPKLSSADAELNAAELVRLDRYTGPAGDRPLDLLGDIFSHKSSLLLPHAVVPTRLGRPAQP